MYYTCITMCWKVQVQYTMKDHHTSNQEHKGYDRYGTTLSVSQSPSPWTTHLCTISKMGVWPWCLYVISTISQLQLRPWVQSIHTKITFPWDSTYRILSLIHNQVHNNMFLIALTHIIYLVQYCLFHIRYFKSMDLCAHYFIFYLYITIETVKLFRCK